MIQSKFFIFSLASNLFCYVLLFRSLNDFTDFNPRGGKFIRNRMGTGGKGRKGGKNRPGKDARQKARTNRRG
jgi:hypothetical protein